NINTYYCHINTSKRITVHIPQHPTLSGLFSLDKFALKINKKCTINKGKTLEKRSAKSLFII
ncbi:MAG: hypothetical protein KBF13_06985, partial [Prevotella sp.]|nr:hypothetical protein [Prevotella sp.]